MPRPQPTYAGRFWLHLALLLAAGASLWSCACEEPVSAHDIGAAYAEALSRYDRGDYEGARKGLEEVVRMAPHHVPAMRSLGLARLHLGDVAGAETVLSQAVLADPRDVRARLALAATLLRAGRTDEAMAAYAEAEAAARPVAGSDARFAMADDILIAYLDSHRDKPPAPTGSATATAAPTAGTTSPTTAASGSPGTPATAGGSAGPAPDLAIALENGTRLLREKRYAEALKPLTLATTLDPFSARASLLLGEAYFGMKNHTAAALHYKRAAELQPDAAVAHRYLGNALYNLKDFDGAIAAYERAVALAPTDVDTVLFLADALVSAGDGDAALVHYERALMLSPENERARRAVERLGAAKGVKP